MLVIKKIIKFICFFILFFSFAVADESNNKIFLNKITGEWHFELKNDQRMDAYAYAESWRYPKILKFFIQDNVLKVSMTDQHGFLTKNYIVYTVNDDGIVFWGDLGMKEKGVGRYPIHRLFMKGNRLEGFIVTDEVLFEYVGKKINEPKVIQ